MQIPLGVYLKNENVLDEMVSIMEDLHTYVPTIHKRVEITTPGKTEPDTIDDFKFHPILFGGDQLTAGSEDVKELGRILLTRKGNYKALCLVLRTGMLKCVCLGYLCDKIIKTWLLTSCNSYYYSFRCTDARN